MSLQTRKHTQLKTPIHNQAQGPGQLIHINEVLIQINIRTKLKNNNRVGTVKIVQYKGSLIKLKPSMLFFYKTSLTASVIMEQ